MKSRLSKDGGVTTRFSQGLLMTRAATKVVLLWCVTFFALSVFDWRSSPTERKYLIDVVESHFFFFFFCIFRNLFAKDVGRVYLQAFVFFVKERQKKGFFLGGILTVPQARSVSKNRLLSLPWHTCLTSWSLSAGPCYWTGLKAGGQGSNLGRLTARKSTIAGDHNISK